MPDDPRQLSIDQRDTALEIIAGAIHSGSFSACSARLPGVVMCRPEEVSEAVLDSLIRAGVGLVVPRLQGG